MDIAGLILGLATVFNAVIEDLEYIQLGRGFGRDFETCLLKLDCARLRISRWGDSLGLNGGAPTLQSSLGRTEYSEESLTTAKKLLGQIQALLHEAKESTDKANEASLNDPNFQACDTDKELGTAMKFLHEKMMFLASRRQRATGLTTKAKWVLLEVKTFNRLIEDIKSLTDSLVDLFPAAKKEQARLCEKDEVYAFSETLLLLKNVCDGQDNMLGEFLTKMLSTTRSTNTWNNADSRIGNQSEKMYGNIDMRG